MKTTYIKISLLSLFSMTAIVASCSKLLDEKPNQSITTINTLKDLQGVLRQPNMISFGGLVNIGADQYVHSNSAYSTMAINFQNAYRWDKDALFDIWSGAYRGIYAANLVLTEMERIKEGTEFERNDLRGQALFFRAFSLYQLTQVYCRPYGPDAQTALGLPLRLTPNVEEKISRASLQETYNKIIGDTKEAIGLLPLRNIAINLPGKISCYGFLAKMYLSMREYSEAEKYSSLYLAESPQLLDYNTLDTLANPSIPRINLESTFDAGMTSVSTNAVVTANPILIQSYHTNDLRKKVLFMINADGSAVFKGSYFRSVSNQGYCGIATDEVYLIRSECLVRLNRIEDGLKDLNYLLVRRWKTNRFTPVQTTSKEDAIQILINERNKELIFRGTRWSDLRRLNEDGANISLSRTINGVTYNLPAKDNRWIWLIPAEVINLSGIQQNER
ncbi:RagB/SusD family nutrient uptake outer membrane protein [Chitinophaga niabensis]|uniref:SusD family protein n=1 Tax=Chitinophaga niabensis TaxID=536979 RepID=A0A1N6E3B2_9BACT|nr:RagB/SusD family nutrient uptake outer membrane protein [Chitinophaga niabensis]SIN77482.1 SusD family protein [Chitinophaga niabensis]